MNPKVVRHARLIGLCTIFTVLALAPAAGASSRANASSLRGNEVIRISGGEVRGAAVNNGYTFRGLPYAAPPVGALRWRPPQPPLSWDGVRDATQYAASCPQAPSPFAGPGPFSEDCLYLNVTTPTLERDADRPVLVWIHGGGLTQDASRNYDASELAAKGVVVVTIDYRLGALGFLAHPAFASSDGAAGNYGYMDQTAALRWVQQNVAQFGGNPHNVTIAGQSAGGLSVLAHLVSSGSRGLFQRAIVESGAFALTQIPLANAEAFGEQFATKVGCASQSAQCLRHVPLETLVNDFPAAAIPGVVDGKVLTESIGTALAAGKFARVPIINGINHDEEALFVFGLQLAVSNGQFVPIDGPVTDTNYEQTIASIMGVSATRAASIAAQYPVSQYGGSPSFALSVLLSDANFACTALNVDTWTSARVPTFAYEFDDDTAPNPFGALPVATHESELPYLFQLPNAPIQTPLTATQQGLAATMQSAWARFAAIGNPSTQATPWPSFALGGGALSLVSPQPQIDSAFAAQHNCAFWAAS
jgi:para-nitrobenzyl esterase